VSASFSFWRSKAGVPPKVARFVAPIPLRKFCEKILASLRRPQVETCEVVTSYLRKPEITVMPDDEKQVLEGIRRNVIEMNRRLHDISRFVGVTALIGVIACALLLLILWRNW
jgi:hypothetical protein